MLQHFNMNLLIRKYVYPIFGASTDEQLVHHMTVGVFIYTVLVLLLPLAAPYGRYSSRMYGFGVPARWAWLIQESPAFVVPLTLAVTAQNKVYTSLSNQLCLGLFIMHYFQRAMIFPFLIKSARPVPFVPFVCAFLTCLYNGVLHGVYFTSVQSYDDKVWLWKPYLWIGIAITLLGMKINIGSDSALRKLRLDCSTEYLIPYGGLFEYVSCANYLGEVVEVWGYALASCAPPAVAHATFTTCFLVRRARQHHGWYQKKFDNYPANRKAIIPFLL